MPSKFNKVQKQVSKKKGTRINALHENSRDSKRLRAASARDDKIARAAAVREKANQEYRMLLHAILFCSFVVNEKSVLRILHFQEQLPESCAPLSDSEIHELVAGYISRDDEELEQLKAERRPGRPVSRKQEILEQRRASEEKEYEAGLWMPDMRDQANNKKLRDWKHTWGALSQINFVRIYKDGAIKESAFPPKGAA
ncbi:translation machinery-associated protein 16 [Taxawa tesnikishii (nom. ined.)]|nr:translation machinery-associated protein 16 [Dothideales sp. JES 119]